MIPSVARWTCEPYSAARAQALATALGMSPYAASILVRRGLGDLDDARSFLAAVDYHDPSLLPAMDSACKLILEHVQSDSRVAVFGDYDVDGVCSTAIMVNALRVLGHDPIARLPTRDEGYGFSELVVRELAAKGVRLIVTVDCGVTAVAEVELARSLGIDVIVTDHHLAGESLPDCPVVHPALGDYPFKELCGSGVAFKLSEALRDAAGLDPLGAEDDLDLAGLATVCDMVPLVGENRRIAREGLAALGRTQRPGLRALMRVASLDSGQVSESDVGFRLGPRINAAGRLGSAETALELMLTDDPERATSIARELDSLNQERHDVQLRITSEAEALCESQLSQAAIVVAAEGWHPGVVGIVAARLVESHHRPCIAIALEGATGRGSARSIPAYDVHAGIAAGSDHLLRFGGHRAAAGLEIETGNVDAFRAAFAAHARDHLSPEDLVQVQEAHAVVPGAMLTLDFAEELERLGPFGAGNPAPVLMVPAARIEHVTSMGQSGQHARFSLAAGGVRARGVAFNASQSALAEAGASEHDVAVSLERNRWKGSVEARVLLRSLTPTCAGEVELLGPEPVLGDAVERELSLDPAHWSADIAASIDDADLDALLDRRGEGFAGLVGDLLTSGESVLVVVADAARRRSSFERLVAGMAPGALAVIGWEAIYAESALAADFAHVVVLDPPATEDGLDLLAALATGKLPRPSASEGSGGSTAAAGPLVHLVWGATEREFALSCWQERLNLRPALVELWRALDSAGELSGPDLERALRGDGAHPRNGALCGRLVRVLCELELAVWERAGDGGAPVLRRGASERTELERSPAYRAYAERLAASERYLTADEYLAAAVG